MSIVTAADVRAHLNLPDTTHDSELAHFIDAAQVVVENITGPVISQAVTEWHDGGRVDINLRNNPVLSVTTVTEYIGSTPYSLTEVADVTTATAYTYTRVNDVLTRRTTGGTPVPFAFGALWFTNAVKVVYAAGLSTVPENVRLAALELVRHWYQQTQQGGRPAFPGTPSYESEVMSVTGYAIPNRVRELLEPNRRIPGMA